ncbi:MAG: YbaB/EbfC family nucleoid-associated protein [Candidatus Hatepunaea meridiana]|nr:YbaB/EbfC family nucleoid-associated protein [Candidatus Hatepunaea meridiana]
MKAPRAPKGMNKIIKQAQKMQTQMASAQEEIARLEVEETAGGGAVTVRINGQTELLSLTIDPEIVDPDDVETLEDLVLVAVNQAIKKVQSESEELMGKVTGGLGNLGMPGMPF